MRLDQTSTDCPVKALCCPTVLASKGPNTTTATDGAREH